MKFKKVILTLLPVLPLFAACRTAPEESESSSRAVSPSSGGGEPEQTAYSYDGDTFLRQYREAQKRVEQGERPAAAAPEEPEESGFALIPLQENLYGTACYAILPLSERALTEEEFLQLAEGMDGISPKELLTPKYSRTGLEEDAACLRQNRALFRGEKLRFDTLQPEYLYAERRPSADLWENARNGNAPCFVKLPENSGAPVFSILPTEQMDDEQLLQYIDAQLYGVDPQTYLPLSGEIAYGELPQHLQREIAAYGLGDGTLPEYNAVLSTSPDGSRTPDQESWAVTLCFPEEDQYVVTLDAQTGALKSWIRWPAGTFTDEVVPESAESPEASPRTEEELEAAAKGYLEQAVPGDWNISEVKIQENAFYSEGFGASRSVDIALADGRKYRLGVSEQDLTVLNFIVEKA